MEALLGGAMTRNFFVGWLGLKSHRRVVASDNGPVPNIVLQSPTAAAASQSAVMGNALRHASFSMKGTADSSHCAASSMNAPSVGEPTPHCAALKRVDPEANRPLPASPRMPMSMVAMRRWLHLYPKRA